VITKPLGTCMCSRFLMSPRLAILPPTRSVMSLLTASRGMTRRVSEICFFEPSRASIRFWIARKLSRKAVYLPGAMFSMSLIIRKTLTEIEVQWVWTNDMLNGSLPCSARSISAMASNILVLAASNSLKL